MGKKRDRERSRLHHEIQSLAPGRKIWSTESWTPRSEKYDRAMKLGEYSDTFLVEAYDGPGSEAAYRGVALGERIQGPGFSQDVRRAEALKRLRSREGRAAQAQGLTPVNPERRVHDPLAGEIVERSVKAQKRAWRKSCKPGEVKRYTLDSNDPMSPNYVITDAYGKKVNYSDWAEDFMERYDP